MLSLAQMHDAGEGIPASKQLAIDWYEKAAAAGDAIACGNLAALYASGEGVDADLFRALVWAILAQRAAVRGGDPNESAYRQQCETWLNTVTPETRDRAERAAMEWAASHW